MSRPLGQRPHPVPESSRVSMPGLPHPEATSIPAVEKAVQAIQSKGGRPKRFDEATVRLNLFIPEHTAKQIRHLAIDLGLSPSQLVDAWARKAALDHAIARGRRALEDGRVVDQDEAEERLSRWG